MRRRHGSGSAAVDELILDVNDVARTLPAAQQGSCAVGFVQASPEGSRLAYAVDESAGYETFTIRLRDLSKREDTGEVLRETAGMLAWLDEATLCYLKMDGAHRPFQVWRHTVGSPQSDDALIYEETDELFVVRCWRSRDGCVIFIASESKTSTEVRLLSTQTPAAMPTVVRGRCPGVRYTTDSHAASGSLFVSINADGAECGELLVAPLEEPDQWRPLLSTCGQMVLAHDKRRSIESMCAFADFLAVGGREAGLTQIWIVPLLCDGSSHARVQAATAAQRLPFDSESYTAYVWPSDNRLFDPAGLLRVDFESMTTPRKLLEFDVTSAFVSNVAAPTALYMQPVPNYEQEHFRERRIEVEARDGARIPVTLMWDSRRTVGQTADGLPADAPLHLYGYGSYGACIDPNFASPRLAMVRRGIVFAIAHVRGGGELGRHEWYERQGRLLCKQNTFLDFIDCATELIDRGIARHGALSCEGRSAGGLLVGAVVNMAPELFVAAVAAVPFVDVVVTMSDSTIPLSNEEKEEWGDPHDPEYFDYMMSYSPINNVRAGVHYPSMLILSGLNDPRVAYWEPTKWAQVLRAKIANGDDVLLKMELDAGHYSPSNRYQYLSDMAFEYAWLLDKHNLTRTLAQP